MTWNRYGRGSGWDKLGEAIAMMAMNGNLTVGGPGWKARGRWPEHGPFGGEDAGENDERGPLSEPGAPRRGRRGRMFGTGELRLLLLALIGENPRHGYELIKEIEEMTGGGYAPSPGAVYPTLQLLEDEGAITEADAEGSKKPFRVTEQGESELAERSTEVEALMSRLGRHAERTTHVRSSDMFRAMGNLASVLKNRARAGKLDEHTISQIVDMIDEMAKRIERL